MSTSHFTISGANQSFNVNISNIRGDGSSNSPYLIIPISYNLFPIRNLSFEFMAIKSVLTTAANDFTISECYNIISGKISNNNTRVFESRFPLNANIINKIEKYRKDNLELSISLEIQVGIYDKIFVNYNKGDLVEKEFISSIELGYGRTTFIIEQSFWIKNVLPKIGHNSYKLVELPITNQLIPEEYKKSILEFDQAQKYFTNGDYDKVVAHCRAALDPFSGKVNLPKLKEFVKSKSEFNWATEVLEATEIWLDKVIKSTSSFTSKTHHAPSVGHFGRTDAEIVLLITTGIIAYIGKIEYKPE